MVLAKAGQGRRVSLARLSPTRRHYPARFNAGVALAALPERWWLAALTARSPWATAQITRWQRPTFSLPHPSAEYRPHR